MLIPKKDRSTILSFLFREGVITVQKEVHPTYRHRETGVTNLYVIKLLQSLQSRGYVTAGFNWNTHYFYLTNDGTEYLREVLSLPSEIVPATLKSRRMPGGPRGERGDRGDRGFERGDRGFDRGDRGDRGDRRGYRGGEGQQGDGKEATPQEGERPSFEGGRGGGGYRGRGRGRGGRGGYFRGGHQDGGAAAPAPAAPAHQE